MIRRNRILLLVALLFLGFVALSLVLPRPATDEGPDGTATLRRLLQRRGVPVRNAAVRPGPLDETFFVRLDLRAGEDVEEILDWVRSGGRAVIADPASAILPRAGFRTSGQVGGIVPGQMLRTDCPLPAAAGTEAIRAGSVDAVFAPRPGTVGCFTRREGWFLAERDLGRGSVVALGGVTPLTNQHLGGADDVLLAWNLLGGGPVAFAGPGDPPEAEGGLWSLLPPAARAIALQAAMAGAVFALVRGRRIGRRPEERLPSPISASELVDARGALYRASRSVAHAAEVLRRRFLAGAGRRLGSPADAPALADEVARAADRPADEVRGLLTSAVREEDQLVRVAGGLEALERRLEGDRT